MLMSFAVVIFHFLTIYISKLFSLSKKSKRPIVREVF